MSPEARLLRCNWIAAGALALAIYVIAGLIGASGLAAWFRHAGALLGAVPAAALSAALSVRLVLPWWRGVGRGVDARGSNGAQHGVPHAAQYAAQRKRRWGAAALALRILGLALALFVPLAAACISLVVMALQAIGTGVIPGDDALSFAMALSVYAALAAVLLGGLPSMLLEMLFCRRFLSDMAAAGGAR